MGDPVQLTSPSLDPQALPPQPPPPPRLRATADGSSSQVPGDPGISPPASLHSPPAAAPPSRLAALQAAWPVLQGVAGSQLCQMDAAVVEALCEVYQVSQMLVVKSSAFKISCILPGKCI